MPWDSSDALSSRLSSLPHGGGFSSDVSTGSSSGSSGLSRGLSSRVPGGSDFSSGSSPSSPYSERYSGSSKFSSGLSPDKFSSGSSSSSSSKGGSDFLSGFFPSLSPFGSSPFRASSSLKDSGHSSFGKEAPFSKSNSPASDFPTFRDFHSGGGAFQDSVEKASEALESSSGFQEASSREAGHSGPHYEREYLHTRDFRDTRGRAPATAPHRMRPKQRKRQHKNLDKNRNYSEQQYRVPYTEHRDNQTDYKYYEDHGGNDTHREHHYRHVVTHHNYYNASDNNNNNSNSNTAYSKDAAYDSMREAKKSNYNVDHVYKDGRYIPIVHKVPADKPANLSEGDFPDGPHVKHHYYHNEYVHDHRNKSQGPTVKHHYHNKDVKVFYHDHRNKSGADPGASKYTTYSPNPSGKYTTYSPGSKYTTHSSESSSEGADASSTSEGPVVKHYYNIKEYHYDDKGRLIDPRRYNYTDKYSSNHSSGSGSGSGSDGSVEGEEEGHYTTEESRGSYSEPSDAPGSTTADGDADAVRDTTPPAPATRSYYYNSNHDRHPSTAHTTRRPDR